jgi:hypothetical protein
MGTLHEYRPHRWTEIVVGRGHEEWKGNPRREEWVEEERPLGLRVD